MRSGFKKFRRKISRGVFFKSLILGLSLALVSAATVLLLGKLNFIEDNLILALGVGVGVGVLTFVLWSVILTPGKYKAARLIDRELRLREKTQTMLEFAGEKTEMAALQRKQAESLLGKLPASWYPVKRVWIYVLLLILSLALCSYAYITPNVEEPVPPPPPEKPFELTEWQETALLNLIDYVENSALRDSAKAAVTDELEGLLTSLRTATLDKQMRSLVIGSITFINQTVDTANTYDEINAELSKSSVAGMAELAGAIGTPAQPLPAEKLDALRALFAEGGIDDINSRLVLLGTDVAITLGRISAPHDPFIGALRSFSDGLFNISDNIWDYDDDGIQTELDTLFSSFELSVGVALTEQRENAEVGSYTVNTLMEIFGITKSELPPELEDEISRPSGGGEEQEPGDDEENEGNSGGYGSGEMIYGSDDVIYYPDEERYAQYGEVINEYYAKITEKILNGEISPELAAILQKYFETLYDGAAKEDGGGE